LNVENLIDVGVVLKGALDGLEDLLGFVDYANLSDQLATSDSFELGI
jgi:hypothetical protein